MPQAASEGYAVIFDSYAPGYSVLASGNNNLLSATISLSRLSNYSIQILTDGLATVDYTVQSTNVPAILTGRLNSRPALNAYPWRDNSVTSNMWSNVATGVIPTGATYQGTLVNITAAVRDTRVIFTWDPNNTAGATSGIWACTHGIGM